MGNDAVKDLREWQRREASVQEKALRAASKALDRLSQLDGQRAAAESALADALDALDATGINRDQCAAFLDLTPGQLSRTTSTKRRASSGRAAPAPQPAKRDP